MTLFLAGGYRPRSHWSALRAPDGPDDHHNGASTPTPSGLDIQRVYPRQQPRAHTKSAQNSTSAIRNDSAATPNFLFPPGSAPIQAGRRSVASGFTNDSALVGPCPRNAQPAVHHQLLPGHIRRFVAGQVQHGIGDVPGLTDPLQRNTRR